MVKRRASQEALAVKNPPADAGDTGDAVRPLGWEDPLEEEMAACSSVPAWRLPGTEEPGGRQSVGSQRVRHDRETQHTWSQAGRHGRLSEMAEDPGELQPGSLLPRRQASWGGGGLWPKMKRSRATMPARGWVRTVRAIGLKIHKILVTKRS